MKNIVVFDEVKEVDLKPSGLLRKYVELTKEDLKKFFLKEKKLEECLCPACHSNRQAKAFARFGLEYQECLSCHSLFISPRPDDAALNEFYVKAPSRIFWREELSRVTKQKRDEKIIKPRFQWILESAQEYFPGAQDFADVNTNQLGIIEEIAGAENFRRRTLINPFLKKEELNSIAIEVLEGPWWETPLKNEVDVMSLFEMIDRVAHPDGLLRKVGQILRPGGLVFMTAITASGFDVQVLWERAENLYPPDRLNIFTVEGLRTLFERHGFECLELSTPGVLDVDIVAKAFKDDPQIPLPRFVRYLLSQKDPQIKKAFQEFLQANRMSSYARILLRKK